MIPGALKYFQGLLGVIMRTGRIPVLSKLVQAHKAGKISRKDFFRRIVGMGKEAKLQGDYMNSIEVLEKGRRRGQAILDKNKSIVDTINKVDKEATRRQKISVSNKLIAQAKKLSNNPKKKQRLKDNLSRYHADEMMMDEGYLPQDNIDEYLDAATNRVHSMSNKELVDFDWYAGGDWVQKTKNLEILNRVSKKFGLTDKMRGLIRRGNELKREGFLWKDKKATIDKYFDTREALRKHTGMTHQQVTQYKNPKYLTERHLPGSDKRGPSFPGIDVAPKTEDVKKIANPIKEAWDEIVKAFYEGKSE